MTFQHLTTTRLVATGDTFTSRSGRASYTVTEIRDNGFTIIRAGSNKSVRISASAIKRAHDALASGTTLLFQKNASKGGISYTSAVEAGVVWALGDAVAVGADGWIPGPVFLPITVTFEWSESEKIPAGFTANLAIAEDYIANAIKVAPSNGSYRKTSITINRGGVAFYNLRMDITSGLPAGRALISHLEISSAFLVKNCADPTSPWKFHKELAAASVEALAALKAVA